MKSVSTTLKLAAVGLALASGSIAQAGTAGATKYPIVLVHGLFGFKSIAGAEYFYNIPSALRGDGAKVYTVTLSAVNSSTVRGEQLVSQVRTVLAATGATKVNLIGHSQGGLDSRYVAAVYPSLVASVTAVGTPHRGSPVAEAINGSGSFTKDVLAKITQGVGNIISYLQGNGNPPPQDAYALLDQLSTSKIGTFNNAYPGGLPATCSGNGASSKNGVFFWSWGGNAVFSTYNPLDPMDAAFQLTTLAALNDDDDGVVPRCSTHFGVIISDKYALNHMDLVNQTLGMTPPLSANPITLFRNQAARLKNAGL